MSQAITSSGDLILTPKIPPVPSLFTTFETSHFIKAGKYSQPVKVAVPATFSGCYTEVFAAAALDLDYDEPNAVSEIEMELVAAGSSIHEIELPGSV